METAAHRYTPTFPDAMLVSCNVEFPKSADLGNQTHTKKKASVKTRYH